MSGVHILTRVRTEDGRWVAARQGLRGERRYVVRWRRGGRSSTLRHGGSFRSLREAEARRRYLLDCLAAGITPDIRPEASVQAPTVEAVVRAHIAARVDVLPKTSNGYLIALRRLSPSIRAMTVPELSTDILQAWVVEQVRAGRLGARSIIDSVSILRAALRRAGVAPNPADSERLTTPVYTAPEVRPPTARDLVRLVGAMTEAWRPIVCVLEGSGMRITEGAKLLGRDVDRSRSRILVRRERTKRTSARGGERWIPLRPATLALIPEGPPERPVWGYEPGSLRWQMQDRRERLGLPEITPHKLRHRYASRLVAQGVPITEVAARLGHSLTSMTLDVYAHVLLEPDVDPRLDLAEHLA